MENANLKRNDAASRHLFADKYYYYGHYKFPTEVSLVCYNGEQLEKRRIDLETEEFVNCLRDDCINWFDVTGLSDNDVIYNIISSFDFNPLDAKSILTPCHAAKIDDTDDRLLIVMKSCLFEKNQSVSSDHICILSKDNIVITFTERDTTKFDKVFDNIVENVMDVRTKSRGMLIAFILNSIFSETIGTSIKVEDMLEKIDDILLDSHHGSAADLGKKIQHCSHASLIIQKNSIPLKNEFPKFYNTKLLRESESIRIVFNELYNQLDYITLTIANSKELLNSMRDLYASTNDLRINAVMRRLTVVSTLFIPITFLVGLWGMNFRFMPETEWRYGYLFAWLTLVLTVVITWRYMKKNKWF